MECDLSMKNSRGSSRIWPDRRLDLDFHPSKRKLSRHMKPVFQWIAGLLFLLLLFAADSPLHHAAWIHPWGFAAVLLLAVLAAFSANGRITEALAGPVLRLSRGRFNLLLFLAAAGAYASMAWFLFKGIPRVDDGVASLFQARLFAIGHLTLPLPPEAPYIETFGVLGKRAALGHWCGMYPPGWPLLLTPGVWLHAAWLINPILGGLLMVVIHELGRSFFDDRTGRLAALMALPSPLFLVLAGLHLSHIPAALGCAACLLCLRRLWQTRRWVWGAAAGLLWGMAFLSRPLDAGLLGLLFALGFLMPPRRLLQCKGGIAAGLAGALLAMGLLAGFQQATTGDARTPGHTIGMGKWGHFGFGALGGHKTHTPSDGLDLTVRRLEVLNENMLGWPLAGLALMLLPFVLGRGSTKELLLLLPVPVFLLVYACYWYYEACIPARYISAALPYGILLAARGLTCLQDALRPHGRWRHLPAFLVLSGFLFLGISLPDHLQRYNAHFYDVEDLLPRVIRDYGISHALVFMDGAGHDPVREDSLNDFYATGFLRNNLALDGDVIYARNHRRWNRGLMEMHPDRTAWLYRYRRDLEKSCLYRLELRDGELVSFPVAPRTPDLIEVAD